MEPRGETLSCVFEMRACGLDISDDGWEIAVPRHIQTWEAATNVLSEHIYCLEKNIRVEADWTPALNSFRHYYQVMRQIETEIQNGGINRDTLAQFHHSPINIHIMATADSGEFKHIHSVVSSFLHDVFIVMNLSSPGCCDFFRARLMPTSDKSANRYTEEISLSSYHFECSALFEPDGKWPSAKAIPLSKSADWYFSIRNGISQVAKTRMEKILFALMRLSKDELSPNVIVWIFYALEQLLSTRVGENRSALETRLGLLLGTTEKTAALLKRSLKELYDYRSSMVHGGLEIIHVMQHDTVGDLVEKPYQKLMELSELGFSLLLVSLQTLIDKGWRSVNFKEILESEL
jgi:hypothetical protein